MATPDLDELLIEGWRLGPYGPGLDPAVFNTFTVVSPPDTSLQDAFFAPPGGVPEVLTPRPPAPPPAPPRPAPLPEVVVTAGRAAAPVLGGLGAVLVPSPIASEPDPRTLDPVFPAPLETVTVTGQRPPPPTPPALVASPATPSDTPNWLNPLTWGDYVRFGLEEAGRFAGNVLRREFIGELADALRPDRATESDRRAPDAGRSADAPGDRGIAPAPVLDTVTVTASRPAAPAPWGFASPGVLSEPLFDFQPVAFGMPEAQPIAAPRAEPRTITRPVTTTVPLVETPTDITTWLNPFVDIPTPAAPPRTTPAPPRTAPQPPRLTPDPIDIFDPILTLTPFTNTPINLPPLEKTDTCNCPPPKKRKPREPRTVCRKGTYTQTRKGIIYNPKETFPCP